MAKRKLTITTDTEFFVTEIYEDDNLVGVEFIGDLNVEEEDLGDYVRVVFVGDGAPYLYCYEDPGLDLQIGDLVDVATRYKPHNTAQVKALGRGNYSKPVHSVLAKFARIEA